MPYDFTGKVAVVTGAAGGIGKAVALAMAERGAVVVVADVDEAGAEQTAGEVQALGRQALAVRCDVASDADVERLAAQTFEQLGRCDVLVNNAGIGVIGPCHEVPMDEWELIVQVNLLGVVRGTRTFLPGMLERGSGYIVNTASVGGLLARPGGQPYTTTKHAVVGFSQSLALYCRPRGIGVSVLCPVGVATKIFAGAHVFGDGYGASEPDIDRASRRARMQTPEHVAQCLLAGMDDGRFVVLTAPAHGVLERLVGAVDEIADTDLMSAWRAERSAAAGTRGASA